VPHHRTLTKPQLRPLCLTALACTLLVLPAAAQTSTPTATATPAATFLLEGDLLRLRDPGDPARRSAKFKTAHDPALTGMPAADPSVVGATVSFTGLGAGDGDSGTLFLPAAFWSGLGVPAGSAGFKYLDADATTGIRKVVLKPHASGGSLTVLARGANWPYQLTQPQLGTRVQLRIGGEQYCARFDASTLAMNAPGRAVGKAAPAPADCEGVACGDGLAEGSEECDDGGTSGGDGCAANCQLESSAALCAGVPSFAGTSLASTRVASGLSMPVHITAPPLDPTRLFIVEQEGRIRIVKNGSLLATPFLEIESRVSCCGERGLLSVAFHPAFESNGRFFVNYTNNSGHTVIARYEVGADPDDADESTELVLLTINQPFANHNGGQLGFGPDGFLYTGMGDGGGGGDPVEAGQDLGTLLGKLLRIDVDVETPPYYAVPPSNPYAGNGDPLGLIWAYGLRNPWRFSFDRGTGDLLTADVGQGNIEEIDYAPAASTGGENYGWDIFEGSACFEPAPDPMCPSPPTGFTMPILEYDHSQGCSVTGGFVYRGCALPDLRGTYFYSDYCTAFLRTFTVSGGTAQNQADRTADLAPGGGQTIDLVSSFGEDARGEIYIADHGGEVFKIVPGP